MHAPSSPTPFFPLIKKSCTRFPRSGQVSRGSYFLLLNIPTRLHRLIGVPGGSNHFCTVRIFANAFVSVFFFPFFLQWHHDEEFGYYEESRRINGCYVGVLKRSAKHGGILIEISGQRETKGNGNTRRIRVDVHDLWR